MAKISDCYAISDSSKQTDILKLGEMFIQVASMSTKKSDRFAAMELYKLTSSMIPENRSDILTLIRHRYFWTYDRTLAFLISVSTRLERKNELTDIISANFAKSIGRRTNWVHELERMDKTIVETLSGYRFYNGKKPEDLLRAIRNIVSRNYI